jgi:hypothetical protein
MSKVYFVRFDFAKVSNMILKNQEEILGFYCHLVYEGVSFDFLSAYFDN